MATQSWYDALRGALFDDLPRAAQASAKPGGAYGLVIEVPVDAGVDTVGAYADGGFRYYNAVRGATIVEAGALPSINQAALRLVELASNLSASERGDGEPRLTVIDAQGSREAGPSGEVARQILDEALKAVVACANIRKEEA
jgi:hypothetical protein